MTPAGVDVLLEAVRLKAVARAGWVRMGVAAPESVAAHAWGVGWLVLALRPLAPPGLDLERALTYATLHDLAEVRTGDLTPHDGVGSAEKAERERAAMARMCAGLPGGAELLAAWEAYEARADPEARWVHQLDRLDMAIQAVAYATAPGSPDPGAFTEFLDSADAAVVDPGLRGVLAALRERLAAAAPSAIRPAGAGGRSTPDRGR